MSSAVETFLGRFPKVTRSGGQAMVQCPAHEDRTASLSVNEGAEGRVLLKCFAGCSPDAITAAMGLSLADLFDAPLAAPERREVASYDYLGADGTLAYQVVRFDPKDFRQRRPDGSGGWIWNLHGVDRVLYRLPDLYGHTVAVVVEGEKDADRLAALGVAATTSVGGAGKWRDAYTAQLVAAGVRHVIVLPDNDEPGRQHASAVALSAQASGLTAQIVALNGLPPKGDVSDYLATHRADDLVAQLVPPAEPWFDATAQIAARRADVVEAVEGRRITLGLPAVDKSIGGLRRGEVFGLMARPGTGKTVMLGHIAHEVAQTTTLGHVFFSLEMPASQIVGRLQQRLFGIDRYELERRDYRGQLETRRYVETFNRLIIVDRGGLSVPEMGQMVERILAGPLRDVTLGLVTIDHLGLIGGDRTMTTYDRVSVQAREIKELAKRLQCSVLLAVQPNRDSGGDGSKELGLGSARDSGVVEEAMDYLLGMRRLDRSLTLSPAERERFKGAIFTKVIKNRHGDPDIHETGYYLGVGLRPTEDPHLQADTQDLVEKVANESKWGRR